MRRQKNDGLSGMMVSCTVMRVHMKRHINGSGDRCIDKEVVSSVGVGAGLNLGVGVVVFILVGDASKCIKRGYRLF